MIDKTAASKISHKWLILAIGGFALLHVNYAYAAIDVEKMLINLNNSLGPVWYMVTGAAYVIGLGMIVKALYHLKIYGELRTMMSSQTGMKEPLTYLFVGAMFLYFPTGLDVMMQTTFGSTSILSVSEFSGTVAHLNREATIALLNLVRVIGAISFIRGWILLAKSSQQGAQGGFGRGLTHIFGGIFAINIVGTWNIIANTFGFN